MRPYLALAHIVFAAAAAAFVAAPGYAAQNAQVINSNVNCRAHPPQFETSTLVTFNLKAGNVVAVLPANSRVEVLAKTLIRDRDAWYQVRTPADLTCWMYAGSPGNLRYLRLDRGVVVGDAGASPASSLASLARNLPLAAAFAQPSAAPPAGSAPVAAEPTVVVNPLLNVLLAAAAVGIFVGAMVCFRRFVFPRSPSLVMASSLSLLLLLGSLSETTFAALLTKLLTLG